MGAHDVRPEDLEYASPHVREITMRVRALQEQGLLVVATNSSGYYALPRFYALSGVRGDGWQSGVVEHKKVRGRLRAVEVSPEEDKDYRELFWVFEPHDGEAPTLPDEWPVPRQPIEPATVTFDVVKGRAVIRGDLSGDSMVLSGIRPAPAWRVFHYIVSEMRDGLRPDRRSERFVGNHLVPWKLVIHVPDNPLWYPLDSVPYLRNEQVGVPLTGFAVRRLSYSQALLVYAGVVGHRTALESIRASVSSRGKQLSIGARSLVLGEYRWIQTEVPDTGLHHGALILRDALESQGKDVAYILVFDGDDIRPQDMLVRVLNKATPLPFLPEWADVLWDVALEKDWVEKLVHGGEVTAAYAVDLLQPWGELLSELVSSGRIHI